MIVAIIVTVIHLLYSPNFFKCLSLSVTFWKFLNESFIQSQFFKGWNIVTMIKRNELKFTQYSFPGVLGKHGTGKCNSLLLLQICAKHDLLISNIIFRLPAYNKISLMHHRSKHWHLIIYVIVKRWDWQDMKVTKAVCGAEWWIDHHQIISKLSIGVQPKTRPLGKKAPKWLNIMKLKDVPTKQLFVGGLRWAA